MGRNEVSGAYRAFMIAAPFISLVAFIVTAFFNFLAAQDADNLHWGIFNNKTGDISDAYPLEITPAGWTFSIWGFIYTYQVIFLVYWLTLLCRKNPTTGEPLYRSPVFMSPWICLFYAPNMALNVAWLFTWDRESFIVGFVLLVLTALTLYVCLGLSFSALYRNKRTLLEEGLGLEIRLVIGLVHNALAMYATWVTIATKIGLGIMLAYGDGFSVNQSIASSISLAVLAFEIVVFAFLDNIILEKHTRYLFTPYVVLHVALIGSISKNWDPENSNSIFTAGLLTIGAFATIMKIILVIYRTIRKPLYSTLEEDNSL